VSIINESKVQQQQQQQQHPGVLLIASFTQSIVVYHQSRPNHAALPLQLLQQLSENKFSADIRPSFVRRRRGFRRLCWPQQKKYPSQLGLVRFFRPRLLSVTHAKDIAVTSSSDDRAIENQML